MREAIITLICAVIVGICGWGLTAYRNRRDRKRVYDFLTSDSQYRFRSSNAILAATGIPHDRLEALSKKGSTYKFRRNSGDKDSWTAE
jgi:hypothetical protein